MAGAARTGVRFRSGVVRPDDAVQLGLLVMREAERRVGRRCETLDGELDRSGGLVPLTRRLQQLRLMHQALATERHESWLRPAPTVER